MVLYMIVMIDNYDSFTYNLVQYLYVLGEEVTVFRNDQVTLAQLAAVQPSGIIISPGPGTPDGAGISMEVIRNFSKTTPILGVCLGHQAIGQVFGGQVVLATTMMHGKASTMIRNGNSPLFDDIPSHFEAIRYHSLVVDPDTFPDELRITALTEDGTVMALEHQSLPVYGVQFHPESVLSAYGMELLRNFIRITKQSQVQMAESVHGGVS
jgi:anthranilate synthase/aminodeoxychorismate synthase-like glutamine amidotransferase